MTDTYGFALTLLVTAAVGIAAVLSNRLTQSLRVPAPGLVLLAAAVARALLSDVSGPPERTVDQLVTVALVLILFDGGMGIGWPAFRAATRPIALVGVVGTFVTAVAVAVFLHVVIGIDWFPALLVATAVSPTDPAVVFSVLGQREISGRSGAVLEGESGANDPVGIALMVSLVGAGGLSLGAVGSITGEFLLQMAVGLAVGVLGGRGLLIFMRRVPLPAEGLYPLRTLVAALAIFAVATLAHGSGFLAVFVAGILIGDARAPYKREVEHFHTALSSLAEVVAFVVLGLTVDLAQLARPDVWIPGIGVAVVLTLVVRPLLIGPLLGGTGMGRNEKGFVMFAGLKGAVPLLLGTYIVAAGVPGAARLYGIVVVVVVFSVFVQGSLVPVVARVLGVPMRDVEPEPWTLGVRLRDEPNGVHRLTVAATSAADGHRIADLSLLPEGAWVSFVVRAGRLVPVSAETVLQADDEALVLGDPRIAEELRAVFEEPSTEA